MITNRVNVPDWVWWGTLAGAGAVAMITAVGAILLAGGAADPPAAGSVIWSDSDFTWARGPVIALTTRESGWFTAPDAAHLPPDRFTLDVSGRITAESDPGTAWGVWIETEVGARIVYAISGDGYTTTRLCDESAFTSGGLDREALEDCPALRAEWRWMPYPRIHPPGTTNTITLHVEMTDDGTNEVRLRLNREIMGAAAVRWSGRWGVWLRGGRAGGASGVADTIRFMGAVLSG